MNEVVQFLTENQNGNLATVDPEGKPRVRPFGFMLEHEGRLIFCTSNQKKVFAEMKQQPWVEYTMSAPDMRWIRITGKAVFTSSLALKDAVLNANALVKSIYQTAENPVFEVFHLEEAEATFYDFSGQPPRVIKL